MCDEDALVLLFFPTLVEIFVNALSRAQKVRARQLHALRCHLRISRQQIQLRDDATAEFLDLRKGVHFAAGVQHGNAGPFADGEHEGRDAPRTDRAGLLEQRNEART
jgi:hypothetical protein